MQRFIGLVITSCTSPSCEKNHEFDDARCQVCAGKRRSKHWVFHVPRRAKQFLTHIWWCCAMHLQHTTCIQTLRGMCSTTLLSKRWFRFFWCRTNVSSVVCFARHVQPQVQWKNQQLSIKTWRFSVFQGTWNTANVFPKHVFQCKDVKM